MDVGGKKQWSCITYLPDDALYLIFKRLEKPYELESFGLTCLRFLDIQNESRKCLKIRPSYLSSYSSCGIFGTDNSIVDKLLNRFRHLESLSLNFHLDVSDICLTPLQKYGSKLHSLFVPLCSHVTDIGLDSIASGCPLLSIINLSYCSISDSGLEILSRSCKFLKEVSLGWCSRISDRGMSSLTQNCRQLRSLRISGCDKIIGVSFEGCSPTLACLEADSCGFDSTGLTRILSGGGLEYLNISSPHGNPSGLGLAMIGLGSATNLKILDFEMCNFVGDDAIMIISKGCPLLQEWNLSYCQEIELSGWESIGLYCQNLERLHVRYCWNLCDSGLLALGNGCKRLSILYMDNCSKITAYGIKILKRRREDLEIKDEGVREITPSWAFST